MAVLAAAQFLVVVVLLISRLDGVVLVSLVVALVLVVVVVVLILLVARGLQVLSLWNGEDQKSKPYGLSGSAARGRTQCERVHD